MDGIQAHDSLTKAGIKCLTGSGQLAEFSCEKEFFPFEKSVSGRSRRQIADLIVANKDAEVAKKCLEKANHVRDECVESHKEGCSRTGL